VLEAGHIYEIVGGKQTPVPGIDATVTADFKSYGGPHGMAAAVAAGALPAGVGAILYDPESWSYTPSVEQHHLASYVSQALALAHSKGLRLIVTPGVDLTGVLEQGTTSADTVQNYLSSGIDAAVAPADVVDIQAQRFEADAASYASFVRQVAEQIRAKNPRAVIVAGLSTNPASIPAGVTSTMLSSSIDATRGLVSGYWLNIPNPGQSCPTCPPADPSVGIEALQIAFG
jgi:hypothetical protein